MIIVGIIIILKGVKFGCFKKSPVMGILFIGINA
jgi:hypothetical protein